MITINLLPEELRPRRRRGFSLAGLKPVGAQEIRLKVLVIWSAAFLIATQSILLAFQIYNRSKLKTINNRYSSLSVKKKDADEIRKKIGEMSKQAPLIEELAKRRFSWAEKLNALSDSLTPGAWIAELSYNEQAPERSADFTIVEEVSLPKVSKIKSARNSTGAKRAGPAPAKEVVSRSLVLSGYAYSSSEDATAVISRFINSLKVNKLFYSDFSNIAVEDINGEKFETQEVMSFKIVCPFKE